MMTDLAITSVGMLSSVGNAVDGCAAIRAGIARPAPIVGAALRDPETGEEVAVTGHPIRGATEGFMFVGLWIRMAALAIADLMRYRELPNFGDAGFWRSCDLTLVTPALDNERFPLLDEPPDLSFLETTYATSLVGLCKAPFPPDRVRAIATGHVGVAMALDAAAKRIQAREADRSLIVAVDSYLDPDALAWLGRHQRLKHGGNPVGLSPGEAATAILVESRDSAGRRGASVDGWVGGVSLLDTGRAYSGDEPRDGAALSSAVVSVLDSDAPFTGDLVTDINGEEWRARELGGVFARLGARLAGSKIVTPAVSLGDSGAVSGGVGVCVTIRAYQRAYATSPQSLVLSMSDDGFVAAIRVDRSPDASDSSGLPQRGRG